MYHGAEIRCINGGLPDCIVDEDQMGPGGRRGQGRIVAKTRYVGWTGAGEVALAALCALTGAVVLTNPLLEYRSDHGNVLLTCAGVAVTIAAAGVAIFRFRSSPSPMLLALLMALLFRAISMFGLLGLPTLIGVGSTAPLQSALALTCFCSALLFWWGAAGGVNAPVEILTRPSRIPCRACAVTAAAAVAVTGAGLLIGVLWPGANLNHAAAGSAGLGRLADDGAPLLIVQLSTATMWALAALCFARRSAENCHARTFRWLSVSAILAVWRCVDAVLAAPAPTDTGSLAVLLRTGSMLALGVAAMYESIAALRGVRESAAQDERRRLARELHDGLAQELAFIVSRTRRPTSAGIEPATLVDIGSAAESALDQSRMAIYELRHAASRQWVEAIEARANELARRSGLELQFQARGELQVDEALEHGIVAIVQEAISNAARHAGATKIDISISTNAGALLLWISDDGCGFEPVEHDPTRDGGLGLRSMRERARELGGELSLESVPGRGTTIKLAV